MSAKVSSLSAEIAYTPSGPAEVSALALEVGYRISFADADISGLSAEVAYAEGGTAQASSLFAEVGYEPISNAVARISSLFAEVARSTVLQVPLDLVAITPALGAVEGGEAVTLTGTGFLAAARVTFDGVTATSVVVVDDTTITCLTPAHGGGPVTVTVTLPDGRSDSLVYGFTYFRIPPYQCQDRFPAQEPLS